VLINIINNAWQAMSGVRKPGLLHVATAVGSSTFYTKRLGEPKMIRITIQDDGPGIPQDMLSSIFDPFFTTKPEGEGTGLGLSICHGIIAEHGGHIWAESELGHGATFFIELPIVDSEATVPPVKVQSLSADSPSNVTRVLLIDDEAPLLEVLALALKRRGYSVDTANDGTLALARLHRKKYDLILCDMNMPELNGSDLYRQIQGKYPELAPRVVFTSGDILNLPDTGFLRETGSRLLTKPFELDELIAQFNDILRHSETPADDR
jgi:two-component system NtrC family sensor kinase